MKRCGLAAVAFVLLAGTPAGRAMAQEGLQKARHRHRAHAVLSESAARPLTVNPAPVAPAPPATFEPSLVGQDDADSYGNIAAFNPSPYTTSGTQFPFGLDGVGGFGSDLGFGAGEDGSVYQR